MSLATLTKALRVGADGVVLRAEVLTEECT